jgi:hypothetical protein
MILNLTLPDEIEEIPEVVPIDMPSEPVHKRISEAPSSADEDGIEKIQAVPGKQEV